MGSQAMIMEKLGALRPFRSQVNEPESFFDEINKAKDVLALEIVLSNKLHDKSQTEVIDILLNIPERCEDLDIEQQNKINNLITQAYEKTAVFTEQEKMPEKQRVSAPETGKTESTQPKPNR